MEDKKNKELEKDKSLKYFIKLMCLVFILIMFSSGIIFFTIFLISRFWYFVGYKINQKH